MSEFTIGWIGSGSGLGLLIASTLYWIGGRDGTSKLWRRLGGAFILALTVNLSSLFLGNWEIIYLLVFPCLFAGFSMGYGGDNLLAKIIRRTLYAIGVTGSGLIFAFTIGGAAWGIFIFHAIIGLTSVWLGVRNPFHAVAEEWAICMVLNLGLIFYPFVR